MIGLIQIMEDRHVEISAMGAHYLVLKLKSHALDASFAFTLRKDPQFLEQLSAVSRLVVDLSQVSVANSSGLAVLVELFQAMPAGAHLYVVKANIEVSQLLKDTFLDQLFPMFDHLEDIPVEHVGESR